MPRRFFHTTAELMVRVVEAVHVSHQADSALIERFCDLSSAQAVQALGLAQDIGLIESHADGYFQTLSPLSRFLNVPKDARKASLVRISLESYEPFIVFRERLLATGNADSAAQQTIALLDLTTHREDTKDTLLSLATYSGAIVSKGAGRYEAEKSTIDKRLTDIGSTCSDMAAAEIWVRNRLGAAADVVSRDDVLLKLAGALVKAVERCSEDAVTEGGNAFESYLAELAVRMSVNLGTATGITSKLDRFRDGDKLPKKIVEASKYIGQLRNAAGHGVDTDIGASWIIQPETGLDFVQVVCSMISACHEREHGVDFKL